MEIDFAKFIFQLMSKAGMDSAADDVKQDYAIKLTEKIQEHILLMALGHLNERDGYEIEKMLTEGKSTPDDILDFFKKKIPNFPVLVDQSLEKFEKDFMIELKG